MPPGFLGLTVNRPDIFGFVVMLFFLLAKQFPHCSATPTQDELVAANDRHNRMDFPTLSNNAYPHFAIIVHKCFSIMYESAAEILMDFEQAWSTWNFEIQICCPQRSVRLLVRSSFLFVRKSRKRISMPRMLDSCWTLSSRSCSNMLRRLAYG